MEPLDPFSTDAKQSGYSDVWIGQVVATASWGKEPKHGPMWTRKKNRPLCLVREELVMNHQLQPNLPSLRTGQHNLGHFGVPIPTTSARFHSSLLSPEKAFSVILKIQDM